MASILKVDEMQGVTSAGDITITSEGGAATMSLQQGVAKAWAKCSADGTSINDSFNISSLADDGTALQTLSLTNSMSDTAYPGLATSIDSTCILIVDSHAAGSYRTVSRNNAGTLTDAITQSALKGDLA